MNATTGIDMPNIFFVILADMCVLHFIDEHISYIVYIVSKM